MSRKLILPSMFALLAAAVVFAADDQKASGSRAHEFSVPAQKADYLFATCVAIGNQEEVAISTFGREKAENADVKKFADMLITDHHAFLQKLQKFAPEATKAGFLDADVKTADASEKADARAERRAERKEAKAAAIRLTAGIADDKKSDNEDAKSDAVKTADSRSDASGRDINMMSVERELASLCLKTVKEKLNEKSGAEFDKCFIGTQVIMHTAMKNKLTVYKRHASTELAALLGDGLKTTEHHLAKAEALMKDLDGHSSSTAAEKSNDGIKREKRTTKEKTNE
jgi:predicted outer membrane protein